ncbi:MAG: C45 family peptidase [Thermoanaerobaculia bacterium]
MIRPLAAAVLVAVLLPSAAHAVDRPLAVVELRGTPRERGIQHGRALRELIALHIVRWKASLKSEKTPDPDALIAQFLKETPHFAETTKAWTPDLLEEVRGIAEGSGQPPEIVWALQLPDEFWVWMKDREAHHCSGAGASRKGDRPAFVAQNMDVEGFRDGTQTLLHIAADATTPEQYVFTAAGVVALNGVNARGIGLVVNTLSQLRASREGLPVAFIIRGILAKGRPEDAVAFLKSVPHASGQNYILGLGDRVVDYEASATRVVEAMPGSDVVWHTNHPLANDDFRPWWTETLKKRTKEELEAGNSPVRLRALAARMKAPQAALAEAKAALRSKDSDKHPVCRARIDDARSFTFGSVVITLSPSPTIEVAPGIPDETPYRRFELESNAAAAHSQPG